jgi:glycosyltransferase involved in cell wall biosynthesis
MEGVRYILDFFAPKMLEELYHHGEGYPGEDLKRLRERKLRAIKLADAFICNGRKKLPYFLAWMLQADRDVRSLPLDVVCMCVPLSWSGELGGAEGVRLAVAGYLQPWSTLGDWVEVLERRLDRPGVRLDFLVPWHWGGGTRRSYASRGALDRISRHPSVTTHATMTAEFQRFLSTVDVTIDLFQHNLEREYAMVTRSVVSLACGVPIVHPPFTEVSPMIAEYDAGWLVDPLDSRALGVVLDEIIEDRGAVRRKTKNARTLATDILDPAEAVKPLVKVLETL